MSISITDITYSPTVWVPDSQRAFFVKFTVHLQCDDGSLDPTFSWEVDLRTSSGETIASRSGEAGTNGGTNTISAQFPSSIDIPDHARPYFTISASCEEIITFGFCTGITRIDMHIPMGGTGVGPEIPICKSCACLSGQA